MRPILVFLSRVASASLSSWAEELNEPNESTTPNSNASVKHKNSKNSSDQPFLLNPGAFKKLQIILFLGKISFLFPWTYQEKPKTLENVDKIEITSWKSRIFENIWAFGSLISLSCTTSLLLFHTHGLVQNFRNANGSYRTTFKTFDAIAWHSHSLLLNFLLFCYKDGMRNYLNTLMEWNRKLMGKLVGQLWNFVQI